LEARNATAVATSSGPFRRTAWVFSRSRREPGAKRVKIGHTNEPAAVKRLAGNSAARDQAPHFGLAYTEVSGGLCRRQGAARRGFAAALRHPEGRQSLVLAPSAIIRHGLVNFGGRGTGQDGVYKGRLCVIREGAGFGHAGTFRCSQVRCGALRVPSVSCGWPVSAARNGP